MADEKFTTIAVLTPESRSSLESLRGDITRRIAGLEADLGVTQAYPITASLLAAYEAAGNVLRQYPEGA